MTNFRHNFRIAGFVPNIRSWTCSRGLLVCLTLLMTGMGRDVRAQEDAPQVTAQVIDPTPLQDDATLRDVAIMGGARIWAVGDRGAIWKSEDGGASWKFISVSPMLERYSLHSVCFLTDRVGWIAGGTVLPVGGTSVGVVLSTLDGGATWTVRQTANLPYLKYVRFFDLENGIAAGDRSTAFPSGVLQTTDGGLTWTPMQAPASGYWNAAAFTSAQTGLLAGDYGHQAVVARGAVLNRSVAGSGLRAFHGASLDTGGRGWLTGDGCYLFRTDNGGASWKPIHPQLPPELEDFSNFRSVTHAGDHTWVVGSPGSVIWHSSDSGNTWEAQSTGDPVPLQSVRFINPQQGAAVGELGRIILTNDGGKTWTPVRGAGRRLACLAVQTHFESAAIPFLTRWAHEEGYRSAVMIATRKDTGDDAHIARQADFRLSHAVQSAGGNRGWIDWRLPIGLPNLEKDREKLIREWTLLTDKRLTEVLLESLVAEIRIWRPSLLLIDESASGEFASDLIQRAVTKAMEQAADSAYALDQQHYASLQPWSVKKLVMQKAQPTPGCITQDPLEVLPRVGKTLELAASDALGQLAAGQNAIVPGCSYLVLRTNGKEPLSEKNLLGDLAIPFGSDARRAQTIITTQDYEKLLQQSQHRRRITAISDRMTASPAQAGQLLGQLKEIIAPLSPEQAAQQLASLGLMYHTRGEWALAESIYTELITRYPDQPVAVDAMLWLMRYWTSAEMNWQRLRTMQATGSIVRAGGGMDSGVAQAKLEEAIQVFRDQKTKTAATLNTPTLSAPTSEESQPLVLANGSVQSFQGGSGNSVSQTDMQLRRWQLSAMSVANGLRDAYPHYFEKPEMQFLTAALHRRRNENKKADEIYGEFLKTLSDDPWNIAARGEAYLLRPGVQSPKPIVACRQTRTPPILDGILSDDCWKDATEIRLTEKSAAETYVGAAVQSNGRSTRTGAQPVVFLTYDEKFLYIAASVPIHAELPQDPPERAGREHDANLDAFDYLSLQLDVDRDYSTFYRFEVDQRGQTREACWDNWAYNPKWYCATTREVDAWRLECAIPLEELLPPERIVGTSWGMGITRILPGIGSQSWTSAGATVPQPALFGLIRFE
ncbi:YCF48-related protein [Planctomicrobium sp. SH661]|uniref:YCF48-related protein n=1 Tax=Planctomicrobium sp. SH661 TaxID=3448124 RepID=UPI003F5B935F